MIFPCFPKKRGWMAILTILCLTCPNIKILGSNHLSAASVFSDHMVFQQACPLTVWGQAEAGERITVSFGKQKTNVRAQADGSWTAVLPAQQASFVPKRLTIKGKSESIVLEDILVGEVWICSGQSNMEYTMARTWQAAPVHGEDLATLELQKPANPHLRVLYIPRQSRNANTQMQWQVADSSSLALVSALGYFFGKELEQNLNVPVGIVSASLGGTRIEGWIEENAFAESPIFQKELRQTGKILGHLPGTFYHHYIEPLAPMAIQGFLWYQGESNCGQSDSLYRQKFELMADSWRRAFKCPEAPFYTVLLAPHIYSNRLHSNRQVTAEGLPMLRQQQMEATRTVPNCDIICINDLTDNLYDIHPSYKWEVGRRMAMMALAKTYGIDSLEYSGPRMAAVGREGAALKIQFEHCGKGLSTFVNPVEPTRTPSLTWFELADSQGVWHPANARIVSETEVSVAHPSIEHPTAIRFGWHETAQPNLCNSDKYPAFPFNVLVED